MGIFNGLFKKKAPSIGIMILRRDVKGMIKALKHKDKLIRLGALDAITYIKDAQGKINDPRVVEPLIQALKDEDGEVRCWATETLRQTGDPRAVEPLIEALKDKAAKFGAAWALEI